MIHTSRYVRIQVPKGIKNDIDLDGYIPTLHSKTRLIEACEAIERNELVLETSKSKEDTSHSNKTVKRISAKASSKPGEKQKHNSSKKHYVYFVTKLCAFQKEEVSCWFIAVFILKIVFYNLNWVITNIYMVGHQVLLEILCIT